MDRSPQALLLALSLSALFTAPASAQSTARTSEVLHPQLVRLLEERGPVKAWVHFRDKDLDGPLELQLALEEARKNLGERQRTRRKARRLAPGLVDWHDVPIAQRYVDAVSGTGARVVIESPWLNAVSVHGTLAQFEAIAALPCVSGVEPVRRGVLTDGGAQRELTQPGSIAALGGFYGLSEDQLVQLGLIDLHARGFTGDGILIGVLDTGFHRGHEAFNQAGHVVDVVAEFDFVDNDGNTGIEAGDPSSQHSHGTYILGCIGAYLPNELVGAAYDASFVLAKTEDTTGEYQQEEDFYVAGLQFIEAQGADLATSSLGYIDWYDQSDLDGLTAVTTIGVNVATANGLVCLTAAGNSGNDGDPGTSALIAPADAFDVITVGAVDSGGAIASFSSDGPTADGRIKPEVLGTGVATWTVCSMTDTDCTTQVNGTSLSTPLLAGLAACLLDAQPTFVVGQLRARLLRTGNHFKANGNPDPLSVHGWGIPDADEAAFDCNGNGVDDPMDIALGTSTDCNGNGLPDECDISDGMSADVDTDGLPDECLHRGLDRAPGAPAGGGSQVAPLVLAPPNPQVGQTLRAVYERPAGVAGALPVLEIRRGGEVVGLVPGGYVGAGGLGEIVTRVPADPALVGQELVLTLALVAPGSGDVIARSVEHTLRIRP